MSGAQQTSNSLGMELIDCLELPVLIVDRDLTLVSFNPAAATLLSLTRSDCGRPVQTIALLSGMQALEAICEHVIAGGSAHRTEVTDGAGSWFSLSIGCHKTDQNIHGAVLTLTNVTAFRESLGRAVAEREYTKAVVNTIADALVIVDGDLKIQAANQAFYALFQTSRERSQGVPFYQLGGADWDVARLRALVHGSSRQSDDPPDYLGSLECDHEFAAAGYRTVSLSARSLAPGNYAGQTTLITIHDITERKRAMEVLRESEEELRILDRVGATLGSELDLKKLLQAVTDAGRDLSQAEFGAFFYNDLDESGEKYLLYTLSGASEEAFKNFPMPRNTAVFGPTFRGEGTVRSADIRQDPRYGKNSPHYGIPAGHVRSYLAVPVTSRSGEVIGGLFFGHARMGVFTERAERLVEGIAKQAAIAIDNARLFETIRNQRTRVEESEQRFRALVQATSDVMYRMSPDWTEMRQLTGRNFLADTSEPDLNWLAKYIHPEDQAFVWQAIQKAIGSGSIFQLEHRVLQADGSSGWTFSRAVPLKNEQGEITEWFGAASDITARKRTEEALLRSEKLATLGRLAATIAHEINNPLEAMTNLLYLIQSSEGLPKDALEHARTADAELKRVAHITRQSLGFYRETSGPVCSSISELLDASIDLLQAKIAKKKAVIRKEWSGDLVVYAVPGELRQVFSNLLSNALDALPPDGHLRIRAKELRSESSPAGHSIRVIFADNGHGIAPELRSKIFDPFFSTKGAFGTGLGLWVTKQIVEKHGGSIRLRSRCNAETSGTVFSIIFPTTTSPRT